ncbi:hypothetical protein BDZ89DRAFT_942056, partial [Hymenopellis radicata]
MDFALPQESVASSSSPSKTGLENSPTADGVADSSPAELEEEEQWGPKTTALPDDTLPSSDDVSRLVNFGPDVPLDIRSRLEEVLRKNAKAFGVGDRLGEADIRAPVNLKTGANPVSLPMYNVSPLKREVIEKQVNAWIEADMIEPSVSPWGAPCVVVFRNGKARL